MRISIEQLRKTYHDGDHELTVIENLTYSFESPSSIAIVGRSGIGKSTLLHLLGGLDRPTSGSVQYDGVALDTLNSDGLAAFRAANVGFIFQFHHLLPEFDAVENVSMPLLVAGMDERKAAAKAREVLERVGLGARLHHRPSALSGGEQQRVAIARAVVGEPKVILADEPTGNLDVNTAREVQSLLVQVNREQRNLLVVVTHSDELARSLDHMVEMHPGGALEAR